MSAAITTTEGPNADRGVRIAFAAIVLAMLPAVLDQTILASALPVVARDLGGLQDVPWIVTAYVVAAAAATPIWAKLSDRRGRKPLLEAALTTFVASSALCALAQDTSQLVVMRTIQGAAAGGLMTLAMAAVGDLVAPRERGRYQGYIATTFAAATVVGPLLGGLIVDRTSWRLVFLVNLPLGLAALATLATRLPAAPVERARARFDTYGAMLLAVATGAFMLTCVWGGERYAWGSPIIVALIATSIVASAALAQRERRAEDPIVPLQLLRLRPVAVASVALFFATAALFAITVFVPLFLQTTTGASATQSGLLLLPAMLGITISTTVSGRLMAASGRYKRFPVTGLALMTIGLAQLALFADSPSRVTTGLALGVFGLGFGMVTQILVVAVQNTVDRSEMGVATGTTAFFRALGGAAGAAVLGAVFAGASGIHASAVQSTALQAQVVDGVQAVFIVAAPLAALALLVVLWLPEVPLKAELAK